MSEYRTTKKVVRLDILLFSFISSFIACGVGLLCIAAAQVYPGTHFMVFLDGRSLRHRDAIAVRSIAQ
jgi:hypothetical protein